MTFADLYDRPIDSHEQIWSLDEKTSLQPRTRSAPNLPAQPGGVPIHVEHEYERKGAAQLFAAFNIQTGRVIGLLRQRKRQVEFIELLETIDADAPSDVTSIVIVCDNISIHKGKLVRAWLERHPRFRMQFTPVHCSWMNQVEQWFSTLQRKRLTAPNFADLGQLQERILAFISEWNAHAHPFDWSATSFDKVLAKVDAAIQTRSGFRSVAFPHGPHLTNARIPMLRVRRTRQAAYVEGDGRGSCDLDACEDRWKREMEPRRR